MKVGVIQSSFIPWRGYFDFIASVDMFVFHDDIQYTKGDWRNRNKIKTPRGAEWLTVPVSYKKVSQLICETHIDHSNSWREKHLRIWHANYQTAPHFEVVMEILSSLDSHTKTTISQLNINLIRQICDYLNITTPMLLSSELAPKGSKSDRLLDILKKLHADTYLSGPSAEAYINKEAFHKAGIQLEYKTYDYPPYPQLWGDFIGEVTILDLLANCGPEAKKYIHSLTPDTIQKCEIASHF